MSDKFKNLIMTKVVPEGYNMNFAKLTPKLLDEIIAVCNEVKDGLESETDMETVLFKKFKEMKAIIDSDMDWNMKYSLVFSDNISVMINDLVNIEWCDPDSDYEDDVLAYYRGVNDKFKDMDIIEK